MAALWHHISEMGLRYGVDPLLFSILYVAHHPLFWGTMAWLAASVRRKRPVGLVIALAVFFWLMPYAYIFLFGHNLPWWSYVVAAVVLAVGGTHAYKEIRRRLRAGAEVGT